MIHYKSISLFILASSSKSKGQTHGPYGQVNVAIAQFEKVSASPPEMLVTCCLPTLKSFDLHLPAEVQRQDQAHLERSVGKSIRSRRLHCGAARQSRFVMIFLTL